MTQDEVDAYKRAMLEKYQAQQVENEAIRKKLEAEKTMKVEAERRKKEEEESRKAAETAKKVQEQESRLALENYRRQQEEQAGARQMARAPTTRTMPSDGSPLSIAMPSSARGAPSNNMPHTQSPVSARRGLPIVDELYNQAAALAAGQKVPTGMPRDEPRGWQAEEASGDAPAFDPAIQLELETIQSLIESAESTELLVSSEAFNIEAESEEDRERARQLAAEEAERKRKEDELRQKREREAEEMAKQLNFSFTIQNAAPAAPPPSRGKQAAIDADFDAMLANLQQATEDLDL
jgi:hypothetical protein